MYIYNTEWKYVHNIFFKGSGILKLGTHLVCLSSLLILLIPPPLCLYLECKRHKLRRNARKTVSQNCYH